MSYTDLTLFTRDEECFGENVARTLRIISKLLLDWSNFQCAQKSKNPGSDERGSQKGALAPKPPPLDIICFDKLSEFFCRIWNELSAKEKVRYSTALLRRRGFHGPGRALHIKRREDERISLGKEPHDYRVNEIAYTAEIIEKLKPTQNNARELFRLDGKSWDPSCKVSSQLDDSQWTSWVRVASPSADGSAFLTSVEVNYVLTISSALSQLSPKEIRALGTHCSAQETKADILFNLMHWTKNFEDIVKSLNNGSHVQSAAFRLVTTAREVLNKSGINIQYYSSAVNRFTRAIPSGGSESDILQAFSDVQSESNHIWNDVISPYAGKAHLLVAFSCYCRYGLSLRGAIHKLTKKEAEEATEALDLLSGQRPDLSDRLWGFDVIRGGDGREWANNLDCVVLSIFGDLLPTVAARRRDLGVP